MPRSKVANKLSTFSYPSAKLHSKHQQILPFISLLLPSPDIQRSASRLRKMRFGPSPPAESVVVATDANRNRLDISAVKWALGNVVRPKDRVIVLGILSKLGKKSSCFPFYIGGRISAIWERLEFSTQGETVTPQVLEDEIMRKTEEYQSKLQPFNRQCNKNEVNLEVKLAAGFCPRVITIEEAQKANARWVVLDRHWKKDKFYISRHVGCYVALMKSSDIAAIMPSLSAGCDLGKMTKIGELTPLILPEKSHEEELNPPQEEDGPPSPPSNPCQYPLSWRPGFPQAFTLTDIETITNSFAEENCVFEQDNVRVYEGVLLQAAVAVRCFAGGDDRFWSAVKTLGRVRHRNIMNLVGHCCTDATNFQVYDWPCNGSLYAHLHGIESSAKKLSWKVRWNIALDIGGCLRYLHEDCANGPFVHLDVRLSGIVLSHNYSAILTNFGYAKRIGDDEIGNSTVDGHLDNMGGEELLHLDIKAYGVLLLELLTGQRITSDDFRRFDQSQVDQNLTLSHIENGSLSQVMDLRLTDSDESVEARYLASAALLCLRSNSTHRPSMSEVLSVVRGDRFAAANGEFIRR